MTSRRTFLGTVAARMMAGPVVSPSSLVAGRDRWTPAIQDPKYRLLKRLPGVNLLVFERSRRPGRHPRRGWVGGDRYVHDIRCFGDYAAPGDWESVRCQTEIRAGGSDTVLRVVSPAAFSCEERFWASMHVIRLLFERGLPLEIYVEANESAEVLVAAGSHANDSLRTKWTAPAPRWPDKDNAGKL
jgi:hypothetical protein